MKMRVSLILILLFQLPSWAQSPKALAEQSLHQAVGAGNAPSTAVIVGERRYADGSTQSVRIWISGTHRVRYETGTGKDLKISIYNDGRGWIGTPEKFKTLEGRAAMQRPTTIPLFGLLSEVNNPAAVVSDGTLGGLGATSAYRVSVHLPDSKPQERYKREAIDDDATLFVDAASLLVIRADWTATSDTDSNFRVPVTTEYSDYRDVKGVAVPFQIVTRVGKLNMGTAASTLIIQTVDFDQVIPDSMFLPAKEGL